MVGVLNTLGIDVACYGNHDFDFGEQRLSTLSESTNFPWTLANVIRQQQTNPEAGDAQQWDLLAKAHKFVVKECSGYRIGFFGLAGT